MTEEYPDTRLDTERAVAEAPATGDARVDDAIGGLSRLPGRPAEEHVAVLEEVHGRLRDILDDLGPEHAPAGGVSGDGASPEGGLGGSVSPEGGLGGSVSPEGGLGGSVPPEEGAGTAVPPGQP